MSRSRAFLLVALAYVVAIAAAGGVGWLLREQHPLLVAGGADVAATLVVFGFSVRYDNSSFYDAYWSVAPPLLALYFALGVPTGEVELSRAWLMIGLTWVWGIRLTYNWAIGWAGLDHEDWRYVDFRKKTGRWYWLVSFSGIHFFPTVQTYLSSLPLYPGTTMATPLNWLDGVALAVTAGAITIETVADEQLRAFAKIKKPGEIMDRGLWSWSRHPNYFGEMGFWWGLFLFALAASPENWWTIIGPLAISVMFLAASIPMLEKRSLERRPAYEGYARRVSLVVPLPPKSRPS